MIANNTITNIETKATPHHSEIGLWPFIQALFMLGLIAAAIYLFRIEEGIGLVKLIPLVLAGFAINAWIPLSWRLPFHFLLTSGAMLYLLGVRDGSILIGLGLGLFALANVKISINYRIGIVMAATLLLVVFRLEWLPLIGSKVILPVLGAMFMFRMILFLYEMQFERAPAGFWKKLNYFFLLPNLVFVIFPVVDYQTFIRNYYAKPAFETYKKGLMMMANGLFHLFLYRLIYYYLLPAPSAVTDVYSLAQYMIASYALIVRLAGIFHFSAGVICLFGFYLPPTFNLYFLSNSFSDIWRRINIYWRDFVTKVFYFPIYFRLKKYGTISGMVVAILLVFIINWFLHGMQWFWILGSFPLTPQDMSFWAIFGVAVAINTYLQTQSPTRLPKPGVFSPAYALRNSFKIVGMFSIMSILWSYWTCYTITDWLIMVSVIKDAPLHQFGVILLIGLVLVALTYLGHYLAVQFESSKKAGTSFEKMTFPVVNLALAGMVFFGLPFIHQPIANQLQVDIEPVMKTKLNAYDREQQYKGYYETLLVGNNLNTQIWELEQKKPDGWKQFSSLGVDIRRSDIMLKELKPNQSTMFKGALYTSNNLGIRDREYTKEKPPRTIRIAMIGGSIEMGVGVNTDETFENLVEDQINKEKLLGEDVKVEILNFAISGNHLFQNIRMFEVKASQFEPDVVLYTAHSNEEYRILHSIHKAYAVGQDMVYDMLYDIMARHNFTRITPFEEYMRAVEPEKDTIVDQGYDLLLKLANKKNVIPLWVFVPTLDDNEVPGEAERIASLLSKKGFETLVINEAYQNQDKDKLKIAPYDNHPNKEGHKLLAGEMLKKLKENQKLIDRLKGIELQ